MRIVLFGMSAVSYWLSASRRPDRNSDVGGACLKHCNPTARAVDYVAAVLPQIPEPYHCLAPVNSRRLTGLPVLHTSRATYAKGSFCLIADGIYAASPELCLLQIASSVSLHELVKVGSALCGTFRIDPMSPGGLSTRRPLTTRKRIAAYVKAQAGLNGVKAARRALPHVFERAASPPEVFLCMVLGLPRLYGGYGLDAGKVNHCMVPSKKAKALSGRSFLVPDLCWPETRLAIEYDSNSEHLSGTQAARDAKKRLALEHDGFRIITVTTSQLGCAADMRSVAEEVARHNGVPLRIRGKQFARKHGELYRAGWSLARYSRAKWLVDGSRKEKEAAEVVPDFDSRA